LPSFSEKKQLLKNQFSSCRTIEEKYQKIIDLGRLQPPLDSCYKTSENIVIGCQSTIYLHSYIDDQSKSIYFAAESDALISNGLASLLTEVYSGETIETILRERPTYLEELDIPAALTPSRANGLASIYLKIQKDAVKLWKKLETN
jgi:cysteine desulfuration protein SufE